MKRPDCCLHRCIHNSKTETCEGDEDVGYSSFTVVPEGTVTTPKGFRAGGLHCGLKKTERHDLGAIVCDVPAAAAGVYTLNAFQAAPLQVTQESIGQGGKLQAMIVNSGNANACTGQQGEDDAYAMRAASCEGA